MKTLKTLLLAVAICSFASCSDDDGDSNNNNNNNAEMAGTYTLTGLQISESVDFNMNGTASDNLVDESECYADSQIVLNEDGTYTSVLNSVLILEQVECTSEEGSGTWAYSGNTLTLTNTAMEPPVTITYTHSDGQLTKIIDSYLYPDRDEQDVAMYSTGTVIFIYSKDVPAQ